MSEVKCPRCGLASSGGRRCTRCGADLPVSASAERTGPGEVILTGESAAIKGQRWVISKGTATIGRDQRADVVLSFPSVSRTHCRIVSGDAGFYVEDAGGANGTTVDGRRVDGRAPLSNGGTLRVAEHELTVTIVRAVAEAIEEPAVLAGPMGTMVVRVDEALEVGERFRSDASIELPVQGDVTLVEDTYAEPASMTSDQDEAFEASEQFRSDAPTETPAEGEAMFEEGAPMASEELDVTQQIQLDGDETIQLPLVTTPLDNLGYAAIGFASTFEPIHAALLRFQERYGALGGQWFLGVIRDQAAAVLERPDDVDAIAAFAAYAPTIHAVLEGTIELGDILVPLLPVGEVAEATEEAS